GIVDHDVDAAEGVHRRRHHALDFGALRHVRLHRDGGLADVAGHALRALEVEVGDHDLRAFLGEAPGDALAEAGRSARDDRDLVLQTCHDVLSSEFPGRDCWCRDYWCRDYW